jgi:pentatricopeptide repeat protein
MELLQEMEECGLQPDEVLVSCLLAGMGNNVNVRGGKAFHAVIMRRNLGDSVLIGNGLISLYCKFALVDVAGRIFWTMHQCNAESWNWIIVGYCKAGCDVKCLELYREMQFRGNDGFLGDAKSLVSAISSCSRLGKIPLDQAGHCYAIKHLLDHHSSVANGLISMYAKCGNFDHACKIFCRPKLKRDVITWNALMASRAFKLMIP